MSQQQVNNYHQSATQNLLNQQWGGQNVVHQHFYAKGQVPAAPMFAPQNDPERQHARAQFQHLGMEVRPEAPGFAPGVQAFEMPRSGGSYVCQVCNFKQEFATQGEQRALLELCSHVVSKSGGEYGCSEVGPSTTRKCVSTFAGDEELAKKVFWRQAYKNFNQKKCRKAAKERAAQANLPYPNQQWLADPNVYLNSMLADRNAGGPMQMPMEMQMQQQAPQPLLPQELAEGALEMESQFDLRVVDPALVQQNIYGVDF